MKIKVLNRDYVIKQLRTTHPRADGECDFASATIKIYASKNKQHKQRTIFHELGHAYINETAHDLTIPDDMQETFCELLAIAMQDMYAKGYLMAPFCKEVRA